MEKQDKKGVKMADEGTLLAHLNYPQMRKLYLDHPDRQNFYSYDFVEALWDHICERYGKAVGDQEIAWLIDEIVCDPRMWEMVHDACGRYAEKMSWEEV